MSDIVTGTVTGMIDQSSITRDIADVRRETALEAGDVRRDVAAESHHTGDSMSSYAFQSQAIAASNAVASSSDATRYFIAQTQAATQSAKEAAASAAYTEAKIEIEAERTRGAMALQHGVLTLQIANDGANTRALMQANRIDDMNRVMLERNAELVEIRGDHRFLGRECDNLRHSMQQNQFASLQNQLQMMNSDLQTAKQGVVNLGTMTGTTQTSSPVSIR